MCAKVVRRSVVLLIGYVKVISYYRRMKGPLAGMHIGVVLIRSGRGKICASVGGGIILCSCVLIDSVVSALKTAITIARS